MHAITYASCRNAAFCRRKHPEQTRVTWLFLKCNKVGTGIVLYRSEIFEPLRKIENECHVLLEKFFNFNIISAT